MQQSKMQIVTLNEDELNKLIDKRIGERQAHKEASEISHSEAGQLSITAALRDHLVESIKSKKDDILKEAGVRGINRIVAERLLDEPSGVDEQKLVDLYRNYQENKEKSVSDEEAKARIREVLARIKDIITRHIRV